MSLLLLADIDWSEIARASTERSRVVTILVLLLLVGSLVAFVVYALRRQHRDESGPLDSHPQLFAELCAAHALDGQERRLLKALADLCGVKRASLMFVRPDLFAKATAQLRPTIGQPILDSIRALEHKLHPP